MINSLLEQNKDRVRAIAGLYKDRLSRSRRLFIEERAVALSGEREIECNMKERVAKFFDVKYSEVSFAGSAQVGFSPHKNRLFIPGSSDLDVACISADLYQKGWSDSITATRAFTDYTKFSGLSPSDIDLYKQGILRRGMIRVEVMPRSPLSLGWKDFENSLGRLHPALFKSVTIAIYLNEYAFCWKQDSAISTILKGL